MAAVNLWQIRSNEFFGWGMVVGAHEGYYVGEELFYILFCRSFIGV